ncbi:hypothetical protein PAMP_014418 [Pampus punctatissimus]
MTGYVEKEAPLWPEVPEWYGISGPISEDFPEEAELIQTRMLSESLKSNCVFEDFLELQHRENVLKRLESLYKEWLKQLCEEMNLPESITEKVGGKIVPFGSYHLGVHTKDADIDALCVGPGFIERKVFFTSFFEKLKVQEEAIEEAFVPVIKLSYDGVEIDLVFARVALKSIPENLNFRDNNLVKGINKHCVRSLNGRNIYSNTLGFLGGVSWAILVARVCQLYPHATASTLVSKFFKVFSNWEWPIPVLLKEVKGCYFNYPVWNPMVNVSDRCHLMPIITPAYPQQNSTFNVTPSSLAIMMEEMRQGHIITEEIQQKKANWSKLFETPNFFEKYQHYIVLQVSAATDKQHLEWVGLVESKIRLLVGILERNEHISLVHVNVQPFPGSRMANNKERMSTIWLIGVLFKEDHENLKISLMSDLLSFSDTVYSQAEHCKIYEEGMTISTTYVKRENLCWVMPNGEQKTVFTPNPTDTESVSVTSCSSVQESTASRPSSSSTVPQATKRPCSPHSETSAKKFKVDTESSPETKSTRTDDPTPGVSFSESPTPTLSPLSAKRHDTSELETPAKRFKFDLSPPTVELSDFTPGLTKPVNFKKRAIKLQLIKYST